MSQKMCYQHVKTILSSIRGPRVFMGEQLSNYNQTLVTIDGDLQTVDCYTGNYDKVITMQRLHTAMLAECTKEFSRCNVTAFMKYANVLNDVDVAVFLRLLDGCDAILVNNVEYANIPTIPAFRAALRVEDETLADCLIALITPILQKWLCQNDESDFKLLHQCFSMCKRVSLELDCLRNIAYDGWLATEQRAVEIRDLDGVKDVIRKWFPEGHLGKLRASFTPKHGNGAVADMKGRRIADKYDAMRVPEDLYNDIDNQVLMPWTPPIFVNEDSSTPTDTEGIDISWTYGYYWDGKEQLMLRYPDQDNPDIVPMHNPFVHPLWSGDSESYCVVCFVNKSWKTYRTISKESTWRMFMQQGVGAMINDALKSGLSGLSEFYCINTETENRELARRGSIDGSIATIDLSSASDSVLWEDHVVKWFKGTWLEWLLSYTRSENAVVYTKGNDIQYYAKQRKFAPMGSRTCFPVETAVFAAISYTICKVHGITPVGSGKSANLRVYGDDIAVSTEVVDDLMSALEGLGFMPNHEKSFWHRSWRGSFRESCGGEYVNGIDVTPIRLPRNFPGLPSKSFILRERPASISSLMVLANRLKPFGFCHRWLIDQLTSLIPNFWWDNDGTTGLISSGSPRYWEYPSRWNTDLQRFEIKVWSLTRRVKTSSIKRVIDEAPYQLEFNNLTSYLTALEEWARKASASEMSDIRFGRARLYEWLRLHPRRSANAATVEKGITAGDVFDPYEDQIATERWVEMPTDGE